MHIIIISARLVHVITFALENLSAKQPEVIENKMNGNEKTAAIKNSLKSLCESSIPATLMLVKTTRNLNRLSLNAPCN